VNSDAPNSLAGRNGDWTLAIDFGTTATAAAIGVHATGDVQIVHIDGQEQMPSMVFYRADSGGSGELLVGRTAYNFWPSAPECLERTPKRRIGDDQLTLGGAPVSTIDVIARVLREVADAAARQCAGVAPSEVCLTHPARWVGGGPELDQLREAAGKAGLAEPKFMSEPEAAAVFFASSQLGVGERVAVYDFGGGTLDTAVLERTGGGFALKGMPGGDKDLGGEDFDDRLYRYLGGQLAPEHWESLTSTPTREWAQASRALREESRRAKEALSRNAECPVYVPLPVNQDILVTQAELRKLIAKDVMHTVDQLEETISQSKVAPGELSAVFLAGGSSQIPLVASTIAQRLQNAPMPTPLGDPKTVVARGAARFALEHHMNGHADGVKEKPGKRTPPAQKPPAAQKTPAAPSHTSVAPSPRPAVDPFAPQAPGRVNFGRTGRGKIRSAATANILSVVTLGVYRLFWWYYLNSELRDIGREIGHGNRELADSSPARSVLAMTLGALLIIPPLISIYGGAARLRDAELLCGIGEERAIRPALALLLVFPLGILVIPGFIYVWYMTKHQNAALAAAVERTR
jgi:hypothetical protein